MYMYKGQVDSRYNDDDRSSRIQGTLPEAAEGRLACSHSVSKN